MAPDQFERLIAEIESDEALMEALAPLLEFYREGFRRVLDVVREREVIDCLLEDPVVGSILRGYGLVEVDLREKVAAAVESVRPLLRSRGGDVMFTGLRDNTAEFEWIGGGDHAAMREALRAALYEQAPELAALRIGGVTVNL